MSVDALLLALLILVSVSAAVMGVSAGVWAARRVPLVFVLPNSSPSLVVGMMWLFRVFVFLTMFLVVTAPVTWLTRALTGD